MLQLNDFYGSILSDFISSYRKFHSCETSLLRLTKEWRSMRDNGQLVGIASMDLFLMVSIPYTVHTYTV